MTRPLEEHRAKASLWQSTKHQFGVANYKSACCEKKSDNAGSWGAIMVGVKKRALRLSCGIGAALTACLAAASAPALAAEDVTPFLPGSTIGVPAALLPPEGVYGSFSFAHFDYKAYGGRGNFTGARIDSYPFGLALLWVPGIQVFGANYGLGFVQPFRDTGLTTPRLQAEGSGQVNTILNLGTLSWNLGGGFFVSTGANVYLKTGNYEFGAPVNVGRNYWTVEPKFAVAYVKNGWNLSANSYLNFSTQNERSGYYTGNVAVLELTATRRLFSTFDVGIGSSIVQQFTNDRLNGVVVPAIVNGRGRGNRVDYVSVGPAAAYDFGPFSVAVTYQQAVRARNTSAGSQIWARINFPIYAPKPVSPAALESVAR